MIKDAENLLNILNANYLNLVEIFKNEKDTKKLKDIDRDLNKIQNLIKALRQFTSYYTMKELKSQL